MKKQYALRQTSKGYRLCEVEIVRTNYGGIRKYSSDTSLAYKRLEYAKSSARRFYGSLWVNGADYYGIIGIDEFKGEPTNDAEYRQFNKI